MEFKKYYIMSFDGFDSLEDVKALVEQDPAFRAGQLVGEYLLWHMPTGVML